MILRKKGRPAGATLPPSFRHVISQTVSAAQFDEPDFERLQPIVFPAGVRLQWGDSETTIAVPHRKLWEWLYVLRAAEQHGLLRPDMRALGFGVGREPIPAALARFGVFVHLSRPEVVSDEILARHVRTRHVDMNSIPDDIGHFDFVWSLCALEHLGSPQAGLDFVLRTLDLLESGGVSVHTTELELTSRRRTADYGNLAVYRKADLDALAREVRRRGFEMETNWHVAVDSPGDAWISLPPYPHDDPAHLKLRIGDSVATSVGLLIRRL